MYLTAIRTYLNLRRNLKKSLEQLKKEQWQAFCEMVKHAYLNVPFYRDLYTQAGFSPDELHSPDDIYSIPPTRKQMFQQSDITQFLARGRQPEQLVKKRTSGSTGFPLNIYYTPQDRIYRTLLHLRILFANGMRCRDRMVQICDKRNAPDYSYSFQKFGFLPKDFMFCGDPAAHQIERLTTLKPAVIYSYTSSLVLIADELVKRGERPFDPRLIFTTGELLTPYDREKIENAFSVPMHDIYGMVEMADVAWQCSEINGYHLNIDSFLVEILHENRAAEPGESGTLTITNLHSRAMPFIRYEIGDVLLAPNETPCPCGCHFPRIDLLQGRTDDWLYAADGRRISPMDITVARVHGVKQYRITQKRYEHILVEIVPGVGFSENTLAGVKEHVSETMGEGVHVDIRQVETIPLQSGKLKCFFCDIDEASHE